MRFSFHGLCAEDFENCNFGFCLSDFDLSDDGTFDNLFGRIAAKYSGKDKSIENSLDTDSVWISEPVSSAQHADTAR